MLLSEGPPRSVSPTEPGVGETDWPVSLRVPPVSASPSAKVPSMYHIRHLCMRAGDRMQILLFAEQALYKASHLPGL